MTTLRKLWLELRMLLLALPLLVVTGLGIGAWNERNQPWNAQKVDVLLHYVGFTGGLWFLGMFVALMIKLLGAWRHTARTPATIISDGRTPLERLEEEFDIAYPGRLKKENPPVPVIPPPRDDNPYSYR